MTTARLVQGPAAIYKNIAIKMLVLNTANFWQHRYTFGYQNCTGGGTLLARSVHFWRPKVYRGGTNLVTKNVPPGTIFARYNFCVTGHISLIHAMTPQLMQSILLYSMLDWKVL